MSVPIRLKGFRRMAQRQQRIANILVGDREVALQSRIRWVGLGQARGYRQTVAVALQGFGRLALFGQNRADL